MIEATKFYQPNFKGLGNLKRTAQNATTIKVTSDTVDVKTGKKAEGKIKQVFERVKKFFKIDKQSKINRYQTKIDKIDKKVSLLRKNRQELIRQSVEASGSRFKSYRLYRKAENAREEMREWGSLRSYFSDKLARLNENNKQIKKK